MLNAKAFANAFTTVWLVAYIVCWFISALAPELVFNISKSWIHSISLDAARVTGSLDLGSALIGFISFGAFIWVITYLGVALYNKWAK